MSDSKKAAIPSWQQSQNQPPKENQQETQQDTPSESTPSTDTQTPDQPRSTLLEQASKFLEDESIRDAPTDKKISFLESKGLKGPEIDSLLGVSRNSEATAPSEPTSSQPTASSQPTTSTSSTTTSTTNTDTRSVPPIITYPEFLVQQSKPPPLVTLQSILYTIYGAAGLGATFYGASEFLVKPMLAQLTSARHDLADTTTSNLQKLNEKLEKTVSVIPPQLTARSLTNTNNDNKDEEDTESITSDPTELFHRDVATQTSPGEVPSKEGLWTADSDSDAPNTADQDQPSAAAAAVNNHLTRLESMRSSLQEITTTDQDSTTAEDDVRSSLNDLQHYLDGLLYSKQSYGSVSGYGVYGSAGGGFDANATSTGIGKAEEDAITGFRAEIRGVKGALLSARNFPAGGRARVR
ncbi:hypothetical protein P168DRAFT_326336 [Aspergillus campestris IBT 28561]|uniref:Peroxisomal membrane protein PEX14 n=1 Tax=Aspergillus campestris (strain IBT 28561) TaxID=1392248 RepID=A0A2I1D851_ASPC2|nr:uncharacterized protein P168DRAFT_326336 [Aspergillus campestris IBT 28561]PKY06049.1 hypothetical protein P168DRAFT_326336 [Aspergillus campestris IBT 28561]